MLKVIHVTSRAEKESVYRFRYQFAVEQLRKDLPGADRTRRMVTDDTDSSANHFAIVNGSTILAAVRSHRLDNLRLPAYLESALLLSQFSCFPLNTLWMNSRLVVAPDGRTKLASLLSAVYRHARESKDRPQPAFDFAYCQMHRTKLFTRFGFRPIGSIFEDAMGQSCQPLVLSVQDIAHFEQTRSPLFSVAAEFPSDVTTVEWFNSEFLNGSFATTDTNQLAEQSARDHSLHSIF